MQFEISKVYEKQYTILSVKSFQRKLFLFGFVKYTCLIVTFKKYWTLQRNIDYTNQIFRLKVKYFSILYVNKLKFI